MVFWLCFRWAPFNSAPRPHALQLLAATRARIIASALWVLRPRVPAMALSPALRLVLPLLHPRLAEYFHNFCKSIFTACHGRAEPLVCAGSL